MTHHLPAKQGHGAAATADRAPCAHSVAPECCHCHHYCAEEPANASPLGSAGRTELLGLYLKH